MTNKILLTSLILMLLLGSAKAQLQNISMGFSYGNQAYYSLSTDDVTQIKNESWDIAFSKFNGQSGGIFINESISSSTTGVELYLAPTNEWEDIIDDVSIYEDIVPLLNDEISWSEGAFNLIKDENKAEDYGWGNYDVDNDQIIGTKVFVLKNRAGQWTKLQVLSLANEIYTLLTAQLDGSNEATIEIDLSDYSDSNFICYSFSTNAIVEVPQDYDFSAQRYISPVATNTGDVFEYPVTGILLAPGIQAVSIDSVDTDQVLFSDYEDQLTEQTDIIGHDWKYFDFNSGWVVDFERANFIKTKNDEVYKVLLVDFGGSTNGNITIEKTLITTVKVDETASASIQVYPNPVSDYFVIKTESDEAMQLSIFSVDGQKVKTIESRNGALINVQSLRPGIYSLNIIQGSNQWTQRLIVK